MARISPVTPELGQQQAEEERIYQQIRGAFDAEARHLAHLMASKPTHELFGQTEFQIRDRVHELGAQVLQAAAQERTKPAVKKGAPPTS